MILGRPTNLWLGLTSALVGFLAVAAVTLGADPTVVATLAGSFAGVIGATIALVAGQPPTLNPGDTLMVTTPPGHATAETIVPTPDTAKVTPDA
jgi:hypothetical protein